MRPIFVLLLAAVFLFGIDFETIEEPCFKKSLSTLRNVDDSSLDANEIALKYYFVAVFDKDSQNAIEAASVVLQESNASYKQAINGSLETLKARDFARNQTARIVLSLTPVGFARAYYAINGANMLDNALESSPNNYMSKTIRAMTYFALPSAFGKYSTGEKDAQWIGANIGYFPNSSKLGVDKNLAYWIMVKYSARANKAQEAKNWADKISNQSAFYECGQKILQEIQ